MFNEFIFNTGLFNTSPRRSGGTEPYRPHYLYPKRFVIPQDVPLEVKAVVEEVIEQSQSEALEDLQIEVAQVLRARGIPFTGRFVEYQDEHLIPIMLLM